MRLLLPAFLLFLFTGFLSAQAIRTEVVSKKLLEKIAAEPEAFHSVHFVLSDRVDLAALDAELSAQRATAGQRSQAVLEALQAKAQATQGDLLFFLKNSPLAKPETVRGFWVANAVFAQVKKELVAQLSARPEVAWIGLNGKLELEKFEQAPPPPNPLPPEGGSPGGIEPGLAAIGAPALWAMGYTGYGQIAFTNDTGVDPSQPATRNRYRGLYVPEQQAWFEYDEATMGALPDATAHDCGEHGTHVTGTILGLDRLADDTIGVAFNAQWIGAAVLCGIGTEDNVAAFQWSLDPDSNPATADDMPDIINNSWYDPQLDTVDCLSVYVPVLEAMEAAGIAVVFSAGNEGPGGMTITPPHNININEVNSFTVGALNGNFVGLPIADFSSRGPSQCGGEGSLLIKPEVSAPGVSVRSCVPGGYDWYNGTSMASPHVSGAVLLLKEAFPELTGKELKLALYHSCTDLGAPGEDNTYGMGIISVKSAFDSLVAQGHVPVSPYRANDVLLLDIQVASYACGEEVSPAIFVENAGTDTLYYFEAHYSVAGNSAVFAWAGALPPRERLLVGLPPVAAPAGELEVSVELKKPNGTDDERPLDNLLKRPVHVTTREPFAAGVAGGVSVCQNAPALLRSLYDGDGTAQVAWFDLPFGGNPLGAGDAFATPPLALPKTFYAEASYVEPVGFKNKNLGENALLDSQNYGITFTTYADLVLKSVKVYTEVTNARFLSVENAETNETVASSVEYFDDSDTGEVRLQLNYNLPPGSYRLIKKLGKPFYANTSGAQFPYSIEGILDITGTTDGQGASGAWHFFYDWEIAYDEPCGRTAVTVQVTPGSTAAGASFTMSADSLDLADGDAEVGFTNTSTDVATEWHWHFGDGATSSAEHPSHTYEAPGTYIVSLTVEDEGGCSAFALDTVVVVETELSAVKPAASASDEVAVFPNPASDAFTVHFDLKKPQPATLRLTDATGRLVKTLALPFAQKESVEMEAADLPQGIYFLLVETAVGKSAWKVVKL